jgi:hypothetical protein
MQPEQSINWLALFMMPKTTTVTAKTSTITNAFVNAITPQIAPTASEIEEVLRLLEMTDSADCAYCGDPASEWDHFRPVVRDKRPTGFITEIRNLVPACGKCNQSKGSSEWEKWMRGPAKLSPASRRIPDLEDRIERLRRVEAWGAVRAINLEQLVPKADLDRHWDYLAQVIALMREAQDHAKELQVAVAEALAGRGDDRHVVAASDEDS